MGIIKKLSTELSNRIAAGEVVERPASVVKELVENAIDAGATTVTVRIENGGISRIHITDNGCGMMREDALECFGRHATSKIYKEEDLEAIYTMGFRGEALSSIAAVSRVDLYTKREQDETGTHIKCTDGEIQSCEDEGMPDGTTFVVESLFYNVPARMKFLKRDVTEASYVTDLMIKFILSHPEISFRYINNRKEIFFSAGDQSLENCIYTVYGKDYATSAVSVEYKHEYITVSGIVGKGDTARPNRGYQSFFVNKRYIKSPLISKAVEEAYKNQVMSGKYPMAVLNINIDASMIDINVHPSKQEVKFSNENEIFSAVFHAVENALHGDYKIPKIERVKSEQTTPFKAETVTSDAQYKLEWEKHKNNWSPAVEYKPAPKKNDIEEKSTNFPQSYQKDISSDYFLKRRKEILNKPQTEAVSGIPFFNEKNKQNEEINLPKSATPFNDAILKAQEEKPVNTEPYKVVGQVFSTYIIVERGEEMLIIDQHAAHERLKFEEIKKELENKAVSAQDLLIPATVNLTSVEYSTFFENEEFLNELGFEAEDFGGNSVVVRTAPSYVDYEDIPRLLVELIEQIAENKNKPASKKAEYAVYTIACKAAIKANHNMTQKELETLVEDVFKISPINTCPHGRPITTSMTKKEMEKEFKRIL